MKPPKRIGHVEQYKCADGVTISYRIVIPSRVNPNGQRNPRVTKNVGWSTSGMTYEKVLQLLDQEVFKLFGSLPITATYKQFWEKVWVPTQFPAMSKSHRNEYKWVYKLVLEHFGEDVRCQDFGGSEVPLRDFQAWYCDRYAKKRTRSKIRFCLNPQLDSMVKRQLLDANWFSEVPQPLDGEDSDEQYAPETAVVRAAVRALIDGYEQPFDLVTLLSCTTSVGPAEAFGVRLKRLNLTGEPLIVEGKVLPRWSMRVWENCTRSEFGRLKVKNRKRTLPIPDLLRPLLVAHIERLRDRSPDAPLFQHSAGGPFNIDNYGGAIDRIKNLVGAPELSPYCFRRYFSNACDQLGVPIEETKLMMGHGGIADQTRAYQTPDVERRRKYVNKIARQLLG